MSAPEGPFLRASFSIKQLPDVEPKAFYIYEYEVKNSENISVRDSTRKKVINEVMDRVIEEQEPRSSLYSRSKSHLYTQFPISDDTLSRIYQKVSPDYPISWKVDLAGGETCVNLELNLLCGPIEDLDCCNISEDDETNIKRSILALISADYYGEDYYGSDDYNRYDGHDLDHLTIKDIDQDARQRATNLGSIISHDWGLLVSLDGAPSGSDHKYQLNCCESDNYILDSINLVDFLQEQFGVAKYWSISSIWEKLKSLVGFEVVVKLKKATKQEGSEDCVSVSDKIYEIRSVGAKSMETDIFLHGVSGEEDKIVELMSAEQMFEQEFPGQELQHKYLPCLVVDGGKFLPMEFCWIRPVQLNGSETVMNFKDDSRVTWPTIAERQKIFSDNCNSLCRRSKTLKKFGFSLELASEYQSCYL